MCLVVERTESARDAGLPGASSRTQPSRDRLDMEDSHGQETVLAQFAADFMQVLGIDGHEIGEVVVAEAARDVCQRKALLSRR